MNRYDLGAGHSFSWIEAHEEGVSPYSTSWPDGILHENLAGIIEWHRTSSGGEACGGSLLFAGAGDDSDRPHWQVISLDPLELAPSIACTGPACGSHGYIRAGRWVDA
jgi:Family of unknown function (DUF6527)